MGFDFDKLSKRVKKIKDKQKSRITFNPYVDNVTSVLLEFHKMIKKGKVPAVRVNKALYLETKNILNKASTYNTLKERLFTRNGLKVNVIEDGDTIILVASEIQESKNDEK